jgi:hypothetical protein
LQLSGVELLDEQHVRHTCDNGPCCNPAHLLAGTQAENNEDRKQRGRAVQRKGLAAKKTKLTREDLLWIRKHADNKTMSTVDMASCLNVSRATIRRAAARYGAYAHD